MDKLDALKIAIGNTVSGLVLTQIDADNWDIGGVNITRDIVSVPSVNGKDTEQESWVVSYGVYQSSNNRMEPDDVDYVEVNTFWTFDAAIACAVSTCVYWAITNVEESLAEAEDYKGEQVYE